MSNSDSLDWCLNCITVYSTALKIYHPTTYFQPRYFFKEFFCHNKNINTTLRHPFEIGFAGNISQNIKEQKNLNKQIEKLQSSESYLFLQVLGMEDIRLPIPEKPIKFIDPLRLFIRLNGKIYATENTYVHWVRRYIFYHESGSVLEARYWRAK